MSDGEMMKRGSFDSSVETNDGGLVVNREVIHVFAARSPSPVGQRRRHKAVNSEPPKNSTPMYMMGVNHKEYDGSAPVVWNASCSKRMLLVVLLVLVPPLVLGASEVALAVLAERAVSVVSTFEAGQSRVPAS
ncbi:hypothetical protein PHYSODRAFT_333509 [Phytophthora sojae]|uniref:Glyceraldehyde 3-phosphate dehydrogenase NAD(P) binding domain-containing protein n=1 Tax=Phytophthora sojae (strain P6497) TaxID=1094619 RepID=G4ZL19_PHYSP|nr:hypothetical protein PHYSODRAFT_333509 [Phytophthora sojae]EGZ15241.1 hypothetical protein PHYSODRAFT_333509 [Phytophthora sojae]|eukprot:XP_009528990.1 hypothetical protein PHYSODRAFT_333509 [Phytophthora sojae]